MHLLFGLNIDEWISFAFWWSNAWGLIEVIFQSGWTVSSFSCLDRGSFWLDAKCLQQKIRRFAVEMLICAKQTFLFPVAGWRATSQKKNDDHGISVLHTLLTLRESAEISEWKSSLHYRWDTSLSPLSVVSAEGLQLKESNCWGSKSLSRAILSMSTLVFLSLASI